MTNEIRNPKVETQMFTAQNRSQTFHASFRYVNKAEVRTLLVMSILGVRAYSARP